MKKLFFLLLLLGMAGAMQLKAQNMDSLVSRQIAIKMKDSLILSDVQTDSIFQIVWGARVQKKQVWSQYRGSSDLHARLKQEDDRRDLHILDIIGEERYVLYQQKKWLLLLTN